jgi:hypothetical protein
MSDDDWLEPLDRRIEEVRRETEAIRKANAALKRLYDNNHEVLFTLHTGLHHWKKMVNLPVLTAPLVSVILIQRPLFLSVT